MPARLISHYRIVRRLGAVGLGEVFLAQDTQLDRPVALNVMSAELAKDPNQRKLAALLFTNRVGHQCRPQH